MKILLSSRVRGRVSILIFSALFLFCSNVSAQWLVFDAAVETATALLTKEASAALFRTELLQQINIMFKPTPVIAFERPPNPALVTAVLRPLKCVQVSMTPHRADAEIFLQCELLQTQIVKINAARVAFAAELAALQLATDAVGVGVLSATNGALATESFYLLKLQTSQANAIARYAALMEAYKLNLTASKEAYFKSTLKKLLGGTF